MFSLQNGNRHLGRTRLVGSGVIYGVPVCLCFPAALRRYLHHEVYSGEAAKGRKPGDAHFRTEDLALDLQQVAKYEI